LQKPQNILVDPGTAQLQIADFGSSVIVGEPDSMSSYHVSFPNSLIKVAIFSGYTLLPAN
jgi:serine/threonine protein kinase